ncbi:hypothetical protein C5748_18080 [Phyllobacterium phragmitis]|uniref:Uncharacterized protein n=1 Tax=Phyllobacterium phragmitis TaxID=2670329 RepID=A0A2S9INE9_9HYPH|nr:hypothetical protein [Phyllobacterium phragmitis]PRD42066.1 hypothetical protein C5748_18080 [Phyllobacterium phragmitis]
MQALKWHTINDDEIWADPAGTIWVADCASQEIADAIVQWHNAAISPATPADKAPADLVPVAYTTKATLDHLKGKDHVSSFIFGVPSGTVDIPLYGPEAAERIAALEAQLAIANETVKRQGLEILKQIGVLQNSASEIVKWEGRAETAEARAAELREAQYPAIAARFTRLHSICSRILWEDVGVPAIQNEQTKSALDDLSEYLFADGVDAALAQKESEKS